MPGYNSGIRCWPSAPRARTTVGPGRCTCCCGGRFDLVRAVEKAFSIKNGRAPSTAKPDCRYFGVCLRRLRLLPVAIINHFRQCRTSHLNVYDFLQAFCGFGERRLRSAESCRICVFDSSAGESYFIDVETKKAGCAGRLKNFSLSIKHFPSFA